MFLKEVLYAHQGCIYVIKKFSIFENTVSYVYHPIGILYIKKKKKT